MDVFRYKGKVCSSNLPTVTYPTKTVEEYAEGSEKSVPVDHLPAEIPRHALWATTVDGVVASLPKTDNPVYIATGGGYGSNNTLIDDLKKAGTIPVTIPSLKGAAFRDLPAFADEKEEVRKAISAHLGSASTPAAVEQTLSAFYSDEVNTRITKAAVKQAIAARKSVIHESASIYDDTKERAELAQKSGMKAILIAADQDHEAAIANTQDTIAKSNTVTSYKKFSARFQDEWFPLFDEVYFYNTDDKIRPPVLIAEKKGKDAQLVVHNQELYGRFTAKRHLDPSKYTALADGANVIVKENTDLTPALDPSKLPPHS